MVRSSGEASSFAKASAGHVVGQVVGNVVGVFVICHLSFVMRFACHALRLSCASLAMTRPGGSDSPKRLLRSSPATGRNA
jgi:hypothetical protein